MHAWLDPANEPTAATRERRALAGNSEEVFFVLKIFSHTFYHRRFRNCAIWTRALLHLRPARWPLGYRATRVISSGRNTNDSQLQFHGHWVSLNNNALYKSTHSLTQLVITSSVSVWVSEWVSEFVDQPAIAKVGKLTWVSMSLTLRCKLVEVFAMICAVFCYKIEPNIALYFSVKSRFFSRPLIESPRYGGPSLWRLVGVEFNAPLDTV